MSGRAQVCFRYTLVSALAFGLAGIVRSGCCTSLVDAPVATQPATLP